MKENEIKRAAVIRFSAMGDIARVAPALRALRAAWPVAEIDFIVARGLEPLVAGCPYVDNVLVHERGKGVGGGVEFLKFALALRAKKYDMIADLHDNTRSRLLVRMARPASCTPSLDLEGVHLPLPEQYAEFLNRIGVEIVPGAPALWLPPDGKACLDEFRAEHGAGPFAGFCPVGAWAAKHWPAKSFAALGKLLIGKYGMRVLILGGPDDAAEAGEIAAALGDGAVNMAGRATLARSAALTRACEVVVSNDSGLMHVAAAAGVPTVGLFGCTDAGRHGPVGAKAVAISAGAPCSPCHKSECGKSETACMNDIAPERVLAEIARLLEK